MSQLTKETIQNYDDNKKVKFQFHSLDINGNVRTNDYTWCKKCKHFEHSSTKARRAKLTICYQIKEIENLVFNTSNTLYDKHKTQKQNEDLHETSVNSITSGLQDEFMDSKMIGPEVKSVKYSFTKFLDVAIQAISFDIHNRQVAYNLKSTCLRREYIRPECKTIFSIRRNYHGCIEMKKRGLKTICYKSYLKNGRITWLSKEGKVFAPCMIPSYKFCKSRRQRVDKPKPLRYNKLVNGPYISRIIENIQFSPLKFLLANLKDERSTDTFQGSKNDFNYKDFKVVQIVSKKKMIAIRRRISNSSKEACKSSTKIKPWKPLSENNCSNKPLLRRSSSRINTRNAVARNMYKPYELSYKSTQWKTSSGKENELCNFSARAPLLKTYHFNSEKIMIFLDDCGAKKEKYDLSVTEHKGKGRGISTNKRFKKGDMILEYSGELISMTTAKKREALYTLDISAGCYMFYFNWKSYNYCVDATKETGRYGRLINHSKNHANIRPVIGYGNGQPRIIFVAIRNIKRGEELLFDYNDTRKKSIRAHPWLLN